MSLTPATSCFFVALGGFQEVYGATAGNMAVRLILNGNDLYTGRTTAMGKGSYGQAGPAQLMSMFSASSQYILALQYSTSQAATIYDRQLQLMWG
jgi:hypothetical protein